MKELQDAIYKIIKDAVTTKWRKEFLDRNEITY
jgi:hypothetical protein